MVTGLPLVLFLILLTAWFVLLCGAASKTVKARKARRDSLTIAGLCCAAVAVGALLALHITWVSADLSQRLGVGTIRALALLLFCGTLAGFALSTGGGGRMRFFGIGTCIATGVWWLTLSMGAAISMGAPIARHPTRFLIPKGYVGWIKVEYGENAPPLDMSIGKYICRIPTNGVLATSSPLEDGWAKDEYVSYSEDGSVEALRDTGWGGGGMIWAGTVSGGSPNAKQFTQTFYVGTEDQYHRNSRQGTSQSLSDTNPH